MNALMYLITDERTDSGNLIFFFFLILSQGFKIDVYFDSCNIFFLKPTLFHAIRHKREYNSLSLWLQIWVIIIETHTYFPFAVFF